MNPSVLASSSARGSYCHSWKFSLPRPWTPASNVGSYSFMTRNEDHVIQSNSGYNQWTHSFRDNRR